MNWSHSFLIAAITGVIGLVAAGIVTAVYTDWFHMSGLNASLLTILNAVLGGIAAFVLGLIVSRVAGPAFWIVKGVKGMR